MHCNYLLAGQHYDTHLGFLFRSLFEFNSGSSKFISKYSLKFGSSRLGTGKPILKEPDILGFLGHLVSVRALLL